MIVTNLIFSYFAECKIFASSHYAQKYLRSLFPQ